MAARRSVWIDKWLRIKSYSDSNPSSQPQQAPQLNRFMSACLAQAALAKKFSRPNPAVGAVIVGNDGSILGVGHTQPAGQAHAEIMALRDAAAKGLSVDGSTIFVSLEPCCHQGRTGPCTDALIAAGIKAVVAATEDPNPRVAGQGFSKLRAAGIQISVGEGAALARDLNIGFFSRMIRKRPWVRMKIAASLDGRTALENGKSQWITSQAARDDGHQLRSQSCAILTGIGTILDDDPHLNVRLPNQVINKQPDLVVVDSKLQTPLGSNIFKTARKVMIYTTSENRQKITALEDGGATVIQVTSVLKEGRGKVDLNLMMEDLGRREINEVHVEAGHKLNGSLLRDGLVDELIVYVAPLMLGAGLPMANLGPYQALEEADKFSFLSATLLGPDVRLIARSKSIEWLEKNYPYGPLPQ